MLQTASDMPRVLVESDEKTGLKMQKTASATRPRFLADYKIVAPLTGIDVTPSLIARGPRRLRCC